MTLLPDATLLAKLGPLAATLARRAREKADADAAAPLGDFAGLMKGANVVLDQKALGDALDLVAAGGLPGRDAGTRYAVIETLYLLSQPPPLRRAVWVHRGARHALAAAVDHAPDRDRPRTKRRRVDYRTRTRPRYTKTTTSCACSRRPRAGTVGPGRATDFETRGQALARVAVAPDAVGRGRHDRCPTRPATAPKNQNQAASRQGYTTSMGAGPAAPDPREAVCWDC